MHFSQQCPEDSPRRSHAREFRRSQDCRRDWGTGARTLDHSTRLWSTRVPGVDLRQSLPTGCDQPLSGVPLGGLRLAIPTEEGRRLNVSRAGPQDSPIRPRGRGICGEGLFMSDLQSARFSPRGQNASKSFCAHASSRKARMRRVSSFERVAASLRRQRLAHM
jgi:hypothetical protein